LLTGFVGRAALAQPANDNCSGATPVVDGNNTVDTKLATFDTSIPCTRFGGLPGPEVWYSYTAPTTGVRNFEIVSFRRTSPTSGAVRDSSLAIFSACGGTVLACDDDSGAGTYSKIYHFPVTAGTTYIIRVGNPTGVAEINKGIGTLRIAIPPTASAIDDCSQAMAYSGQGNVPISTVGLTNYDNQTWDCDPFFHDGWIAWTPSLTGIGVVNGCGPAGEFNGNSLQLALYESCGTVPLLCASAFSDSPTATCLPRLCYNVVAGQTYYIRFGHTLETAQATGDLLIEVRAPGTGISIPAAAVDEPGVCGESPATDLNGGCQITGEIPSAAPQTFTPISLCETRKGTATARLLPLIYDSFSYLTPDADWYALTLETDQALTVTGEAEFPVSYRLLVNCPSVNIASGPGLGQLCSGLYPMSMTTTTLVSGTYYFRVSPVNVGMSASACGNGDRYWFKIAGSEPCGGACCNGTTCTVGLSTACGGAYQGDGTACGPVGNPTTCCPANYDGVNGLQVADIFACLNSWFAGETRADFDHLNGLQVADIFAFLNAWFAGC
jgi:hypothetical protein